jgi:hypothetical protein
LQQVEHAVVAGVAATAQSKDFSYSIVKVQTES